MLTYKVANRYLHFFQTWLYIHCTQNTFLHHKDIKTAWGTDPEFGTMGRSSALPGGLGDGGLLAAAAEAAAAEAAANAKAKDDNQDETKTDMI